MAKHLHDTSLDCNEVCKVGRGFFIGESGGGGGDDDVWSIESNSLLRGFEILRKH